MLAGYQQDTPAPPVVGLTSWSAAAPPHPTPLQDVFSLGCVIAELWLGEGRAFFDLGTLLAYRRGEYDPSKELAAIEPDIAELVLHMIQRAPGETSHQACRLRCLHMGRYEEELHMQCAICTGIK